MFFVVAVEKKANADDADPIPVLLNEAGKRVPLAAMKQTPNRNDESIIASRHDERLGFGLGIGFGIGWK